MVDRPETRGYPPEAPECPRCGEPMVHVGGGQFHCHDDGTDFYDPEHPDSGTISGP